MAHTLKWFIKEVSSISVRNLVDSEAKMLCPTLEISVGNYLKGDDNLPTLFKSRGLTQCSTSNPSWTLSSMDFMDALDISLDCHELTFTIWNLTPGSPVVVLRLVLDLQRIVRLGNIQLMLIEALPINSLFLSTDNGFYISEGLFSQLRGLGLFPVASRFVDDDADGTDPSILQQQIISVRKQVDGFSNELLSAMRSLSSTENDDALICQNLFEQACLLEEAAAAEEFEESRLVDCIVDVKKKLSDGVKICEDGSSEIQVLNGICLGNKERLLKAQFLLEARQLKLLAELNAMYPIERLESSSSSEYSIRGVELHLESGNDEQVSTALGYVVHLLLLVSKYLEVPLRYQLLFFASRSLIKDPVAAPLSLGAGGGLQNGVVLPLYRSGVDKQRFECALQWLRVDVEQLLQSRGAVFNPRLGLLFNIQQLFACESCLNFSA